MLKQVFIWSVIICSFFRGYAQSGATVTFKAPVKYAFVTEERRNGPGVFRALPAGSTENDFVVDIPAGKLGKGLFYAGYNGQSSWLKISDGDKIEISIENNSIKVAGGDQPINNYLAGWTKKAYNELPNYLVYNMESMLIVNPESRRVAPKTDEILSQEVLTKVSSLYEELLRDLANAKIGNEKFVADQKKRIYLQWIEMQIQNMRSIGDSLEVPKSAADAILNAKFDDETMLDYPGISDILKGYLKLADRVNTIKYNADNYLAVKAGYFQDQKIKEFYLAEELNQILKAQMVYRLDKVLACVEPLFKTDKGKETWSNIMAEYAKVSAHHAQFNGTLLYPFEFEDRNGKIVKPSDFIGKYLFIDCWATWCGPCKGEIPFLQKLEKELHGKNIEFISLSMDKPADRETWKKYITEHNMDGVCLITPKAFDHPMVKLYEINSIPRFLLIDKEGKILTVRARRPSDKILKLQLNDLLAD